MSKTKTAFFCQHCGYESVKWVGQCPSCGEWNSFVEEVIQKDDGKQNKSWKDYKEEKKSKHPIPLSEVRSSEDRRLVTPDAELNRVLGGGIVSGSIVLVAGGTGYWKVNPVFAKRLAGKSKGSLYQWRGE